MNSIKQLGLSLQTLGDKKIELLANIQEILGKKIGKTPPIFNFSDDATEELKLEPPPRKPKSPENSKIEALTSPVSASSPKHSYKHISSGTKGRRKK